MLDIPSFILGQQSGGGGSTPPTITVGSDGLITVQAGTATETHQLSSSDDADFVAGNIKSGVTVFGTTGTLPSATPPSIGFVPTAWDSIGRITEGVWYGNVIYGDMFSAYSYGLPLTQCVSMLKKISFMDELTEIGTSAFNSSVIENIQLPDSVTNIGSRAFSNCRSLSSITLSQNLSLIGQYAFQACYGLTHIQIPENVTTIGRNAFESAGLITITIPKNIERIETQLCLSCTNLTTATILGTNVTYMASATFANCTNLTTINVPWSEGAVANAPWGATNATINYNYTP